MKYDNKRKICRYKKQEHKRFYGKGGKMSRRRKYIRNPGKKEIGKITESIVKKIVNNTIEPTMISNDFDIETINFGIEVKACRFFNNKKNKDVMGRFIINKIQLDRFIKKCLKKDKTGIYWLCLYFNEEPEYGNMIHAYLTSSEVLELIESHKNNYPVNFIKAFHKAHPVKELQIYDKDG